MQDATQEPQKVLVLVHPGSACGSANNNLGKYEAQAYREGLTDELDGWASAIIVINGDLSDELPYYPALNVAIKKCLQRAKKAGLISSSIWGCDNIAPHMDTALPRALRRLKPPMDTNFYLTGAWYDPSDRTGCVNGAYDILLKLGHKAEVLDSAFVLDFLGDDEDSEDEESGAQAA